MQEVGWTKVTSNRSGYRWDVFPFGGRNRLGVSSAVTSFFVSEFPDFYSAKNLFELFGCSGNVVEVAISPRRNKFGKRFGFARFIDVEDGRLLAIRLDNIVIEGRKIHVNLPRFVRNHEGGKGRQGAPVSLGPEIRKFVQGPLRKESYSYADVVGNKGQVPLSSKVNKALFDFQSDHSVRQRLEKAYVGRVCIPGSTYNLQNYLEMEGIFAIRVTPMGGNCCLLEVIEEGFIEDLIKVGKTWWKSWFSVVEKWKDGCVDGCRDVWLRIYGVPLHAWSSEFFVSLGDCWGRFICLDENTSKGEVFDVARLLVNIPISLKISDCASVCIDGIIHSLYIREDVQKLYRSFVDKQKVPSSDGESSESEFDRLVADSDSECSIDSRGSEAVQVPLSDTLVKKAQASPSISIKGDSGVCTKVCFNIRLDGPDEVANVSNKSLSASSIAGVGSEDAVVKTHDISAECIEGPAAISSKGKDGVVSDECVDSSPEIRGRKEILSNRLVESEFGPAVSGDHSRSGSVGVLESFCFPISVGLHGPGADEGPASIHRDSGTVFCKEGNYGLASVEGLSCDGLAVTSVGEGWNPGGYNICRDARSVYLEQRQCSVKNHIPDVGVVATVLGTAGLCANGIASILGQVSSGSVSHSNSAMSGHVPKQDHVSLVRGRGGSKVIKKTTLNGENTVVGKNKMVGVGNGNKKEGKCLIVSTKGRGSLINSNGTGSFQSGNFLTCYGEQSEESDICRNNGRQWEFLKRDVGDRLWKAIVDLGVVDIEGRNSQGRFKVKANLDGDTDNVGRKEIKKGAQ